MIRTYFIYLIFTFVIANINAQNNIREDVLLNTNWRTVADEKEPSAYSGFETSFFDDKAWLPVDIPHNWDDYGGYRNLKHGNRHGYAWYRKHFSVSPAAKGKRIFLWFEGVGSYATIWVNGHEVGKHAGGRTSFTVDVTDYIHFNQENLLAVKADHPAGIQDLPWVCGGCSPEIGFSEGSQPMGIFRPVHLIVTSPVRIEPFGIHVWNNNDISEKYAVLHIQNEIKNYGSSPSKIEVTNYFIDKKGRAVAALKTQSEVAAGKTIVIEAQTSAIENPHLWSLEDPYLYTLVTEIRIGKKVIDRISTSFGIRWIHWPIGKETNDKQFLLNGKPVFINGIAEYEHLLGQSHAFSDEQIHTRAMQVRASGFNSFRDGHQPHNLRYQGYWDSLGVLWWPQFAAHIWFDSPSFRNNFKILLRDWVKERRNSPSIILWGLENESTLPQFFAEECVDIIRELDPTASSQRKITTCNGGKGTDWDVPQNWTGTYGGDPSKYAEDIKKQQLVGEYGAWRSLDLHTEGVFNPKGPLSEDRMAQLMEMKVKLADSVRNETCGHFFWLLNSHDNPGRYQAGEGFRNLDRIGPVNYKALFTSWGEPLDVFYMFRSNFVSREKEPMVYIVSHTWPDRWIKPVVKAQITVYSNCDEVELFNDVKSISLGKRKRGKIGTHFQWDSVPVAYNVLYAEGIVNGKVVATDLIVPGHLPKAPHFDALLPTVDSITDPVPGYHYIYRVNCGGPDYTDKNGNIWLADASGNDKNTWRSNSWSDDYRGLPSYFASQRRTFDPIKGTRNWPLFQTFRFGRQKLSYTFPVPDGDYLVEFYFIEPWFGTGGGMDCSGWRMFDVAVNDSVVLKNLDIWKEAGHDNVLKKVVHVPAKGGKLSISFPKVSSSQAIISAIAISSKEKGIKPAQAPQSWVRNMEVRDPSSHWVVQSWMDTGVKQYNNEECTFSFLPPEFFGDEWIQTCISQDALNDTVSMASFNLDADADVYIALDKRIEVMPQWLKDWKLTNLYMESDHHGGNRFVLYKKHFSTGEKITLYDNGRAGNAVPDMYTIIIHKETMLEQPPPPVRPSATYEAEDANFEGAAIVNQLKNYDGKGYVGFTDASTDTIEWTINVGVGDTYGLRFKYINSTNKDIVAKISVIGADGSTLNEGTVFFSPSSQDWDKVSTTTGTSINAGKYKIRLVIPGAAGLLMDNLKVQ